MGWAGGPMTVMQPDDMSGSVSREDFLTRDFKELAAMGERDFIFHRPNSSFIGPHRPPLMFADKLDGADLRRGVSGFEHGQFYFDEAHHYAESYKMRHWDTYDMWSPPSIYHGAETPRGTKPSWIGGIKKTKQQRAAIKARRKQR